METLFLHLHVRGHMISSLEVKVLFMFGHRRIYFIFLTANKYNMEIQVVVQMKHDFFF